ncbi:MAG: hypothetical protein IKD33_02355, partial [Bacteroidales bacterium]|nr:hypothetical protein [Bacteroidales bacterium]
WRTLQGSLENPPRFFGEPSKVLWRTLQGSRKNSQRFSEEPSKVLGISVNCSWEKHGLFLKHVCKGIFTTMEGIVLGYGMF